MQAVPVCGLHHDHISLVYVVRILDDGLVQVSDVSGEDDLARRPLFFQKHLYACRSEKMPCVGEPDMKMLGQCQHPVVFHRLEVVHRLIHILLCIQRVHITLSTTSVLPAFPFGLALLDVGRVQKHDRAQLHRGTGRIDRSGKPLLDKLRQPAGMVDVRMGQQDEVYRGRAEREGRPAILLVLALAHAAVDKYAVVPALQQEHRARDMSCRSAESDVHSSPPY